MTVNDSDRRTWERLGAHRVADNVFRIPLPMPGDSLRAVNVYAIRDGREVVLVDAGWSLDASAAALDQGLRELGLTIGDVRAVLVTHLHRDHYSLAVTLRRRFGTRILLGVGERSSLALVAAHHDDLLPAPFLAWMAKHGAHAIISAITSLGLDAMEPIDASLWEQPDEWIEDGSLIHVGDTTLNAVATPGHTKGHLIFRESTRGLLFTGDHVLPHITPSIGFEPDPGHSALGDFLGSLRQLLTLPDHVGLPAHGPVMPSTHARTRELLRHHEIRLDQTLDQLKMANHRTATVVAGTLTWTRHQRALGGLPPFEQLLAVNETAAHLDYLVTTGRATRTEHSGGLIYAPAL